MKARGERSTRLCNGLKVVVVAWLLAHDGPVHAQSVICLMLGRTENAGKRKSYLGRMDRSAEDNVMSVTLVSFE